MSAYDPGSVDGRAIFVVHGRDLGVRDALFELLDAWDLHPIEWSEALALTGEPNPFIADVLDAAFARAAAVVVLLTPDDEARLKGGLEDPGRPQEPLTGQARPNVLFEAGMAMGRDPNRTILVEVGNLRPFSDIAGRHILHFDGSFARRLDLARRLEAAGCQPRLDGERWHRAGDFNLHDDVSPTGGDSGPDPQVEIRAVVSSTTTNRRGYLSLQNDGTGTLTNVVIRFIEPTEFLLLPHMQPLPHLVPGNRVRLPIIGPVGDRDAVERLALYIEGEAATGAVCLTVPVERE